MRTILISGANRGIGKETAKRLLADGHTLSLGIRNPELFEPSSIGITNSVKDRLLISKYEARDPSTSEKWVKKSIEKFGKIDSVINCAGLFKRTPFNITTRDTDDIDELLKVNVMGPWNLCNSAWPYLSKNASSRIIVLVSMSGKRSKGNLAGYTVSKFALMGLCQTMRNVGWDQGIRVTAICPSWVNTDMAADICSISKDKMTQPEDIAALCSQLLLLPNSSIPFEISLNCNLET